MILIATTKQSWSPDQFQAWIDAYAKAMPNKERILVAIKDPLHQLAAIYAALYCGKRVLSANWQDYSDQDKIFQSQIQFTLPLTECGSSRPYELDLDVGLLGIATSGSSGKPKIVLHKPSSLLASAKSYCEFYQVKETHSLASPLPLHHIGGLMPFWRAFYAKCKLILPQDSWQDVFQLSPTHVSLVPTQLRTLLEQKHDWSEQECVLLGAQALDANLYAKAVDAGAPISVSYGSSESCAQLSATPVGCDPMGSVGVILPGRDVKIIDQRIAFRGEACLYAYQEESRDIFPFDNDGYFITQDLGQFDNQGRLFMLGRADHVFKVGGENLNPHHLESKLIERLKLNEAIVIPVTDHKFGHLPAAYISPFDQNSLQKIRKLNSELPPHERIRHVRGDIPFGENIKVSRSYASEKMQEKLRHWQLSALAPNQNKKSDLIFLHGFMGTKEGMLDLANYFAKDFNVWGIDLPFHGKHQDSELTSWDQVIEELAFTLGRFSRPWIYGYSMGGRLGLGLLAKYPELIHKLIIEGAHPGLKTNEQRNQRKEYEAQVIKKMTDDFESFLDQWYKADLFKLNDTDIQKLLTVTPALPSAYAKALNLYGLSSQPDLSNCLNSPKLLALVGERDSKYRELLPNALEIPNCAHKASYQAPKQVFELVSNAFACLGWH